MIAKREAARQAGIKEAQAKLDSYKKEIAPREKKLDDERNARISKAEKTLKDYEAKLDEKYTAWLIFKPLRMQ